MARLTRKTLSGYEVDDLPAALERLGRFEDFVDSIVQGQVELSAQLAALRETGQEKSYKFREGMGKKLTNTEILLRLEQFGLQ